MGRTRIRVHALIVTALCTGAACARAAAPSPDDPFPVADVTVRYACVRVQSLRLTVHPTSVSATIDGDGPYTLTQTGGRGDVTTFSDGQRTVQIVRGAVFITLGRRSPELCSRS